MSEIGTALTPRLLRQERNRFRRPALAWVLVTLLLLVPLVGESAYALTGQDRYWSATGTVRADADPASDTGLELAWHGRDGDDTYGLDAFEVEELDLHAGDPVPVRYQSGGDGAYLPDVESADPDTLAQPGRTQYWLPPLLGALLALALLVAARSRSRRLADALSADPRRTPVDARWLLVGRAGDALVELTPALGPRLHLVAPEGCVAPEDLPGRLVLLGSPRAGDLVLVPGPGGPGAQPVRSLGRWCRPWPRLLEGATPLPAAVRLVPRRYLPGCVRLLWLLALVALGAGVGIAAAGGGRLAVSAVAAALLLALCGGHLSRRQVRLDDTGITLSRWPDRRNAVVWADVVELQRDGRRVSLLLADGRRLRVRVLDAPVRPGSGRSRSERHLADVEGAVRRAAGGRRAADEQA